MAYGKITAKQKEILDFIKSELMNRGYPPSVRDICQAVNLKSTSSVHSHLETLEKNGYIRRDPTKPRAIEIMDENFNQIDEYKTYIKPQMNPIGERYTQLTGISDSMVVDAQPIEDVLPRFLAFVGDRPLGAHNADFDVGFLSRQVHAILRRVVCNSRLLGRRRRRGFILLF